MSTLSRIFLCFGLALTATAGGLPEAAREQVGVTTLYDPAYVKLAYPNGDVPADRGVCTDVVIRAFRRAHAMDLQKLVHDDMKANFSLYPKIWKLKATDRNIDHRRVPNLRVWFTRQGWSRPVKQDAAGFLPGDIVTCTVPSNLPHVMIVSDQRTEDGSRPLIIHNIGAGTQEEDRLFAFPITGHFRPVIRKTD